MKKVCHQNHVEVYTEMLQDKEFSEYGIIFNPFSDISFKDARYAKSYNGNLIKENRVQVP